MGIIINQPGISEGLRVVVEQKAGKCARKVLLKEMTDGMEFRGAQAAIGLMQRQHLGKNQSGFEQHGPKQIIVGVDCQSGETDWFALEVAYRTLRAHVVGDIDTDEIRARIKNVESALTVMQSVRINAT